MRLLTSIALIIFALPASAERIPLSALSGYLNGLTTVEAEFTQINPDGTIATGTLRINRPGRIRFEYAPPDKTVVLSDGQQVAIFDGKSNQPPDQYPLRRTPLNLILAERVDLSVARMVVGHREDGTTTRVIAQDPENPHYGSLEMVFSASPTELRQWIVTDDAGGQTTLILGDMTKGARINANLFSIDTEMSARGLVSDR